MAGEEPKRGLNVEIVGDPAKVVAEALKGFEPQARLAKLAMPRLSANAARIQQRNFDQTERFAKQQRELRQAQIETRDLLRTLASEQRFDRWVNLALLVSTLAILVLTVVLVLR